MSERIKFEGHLKVNEDRARQLRLRIEGLRDSIRDNLDPLARVEDLRVEVAYEQMTQLAALWVDYKETLERIAAARRALGRL